MNAVEIDDAVSGLFEQPFEPDEFPYLFLEAYGNKSTTIKRLRTGNNNRSDVVGAVLQYNNIHIAVAEKDKVKEKLDELRASPSTQNQKVKFILATDGNWLEAEALVGNTPTVACEYTDFPNHFGYFLPLAGITTVKQISENSFDIRATSRLNKLYVELLKHNPDWGSSEQRQEMNHFMARLIFCFFAEDTDIFTKLNNMGNHAASNDASMFTSTIDKMSERDGSNTHEAIKEIFKTMNVKIADRDQANIPRWARHFPYVNGGLFSGEIETPKFSKIARSYLIHIGNLDWTQVNPDIFGSMIQAVTDDDERGDLGMHYTSVPNIRKVLNPLFLDDLRSQLEQAGDSPQKLLNLRKRLSKIRIFDPACGSGNFLVVAYKDMREIEAKINTLRNEPNRHTAIPLTNFRGIEIRHFSAEIARLALIIAGYQCDVMYRGQQEALHDFLPLSTENWITCGNALEIDWLEVCPPPNSSALSEDAETFICGNPPYKGTKYQSEKEKSELKAAFKGLTSRTGSLDYVCGWFIKAAQYSGTVPADFAFVSVNSICQGGQVPVLWPLLKDYGLEIGFAYTSFKWRNLASHNAGVMVVIVGLTKSKINKKVIYSSNLGKGYTSQVVNNISPYLVQGADIYVQGSAVPISGLEQMSLGNAPYDGGNLILSNREVDELGLTEDQKKRWLRILLGSSEIIKGNPRKCIWLPDQDLDEALQNPAIRGRIEAVRKMRLSSKDSGTKAMANRSHQFREMYSARKHTIAVPLISSENRDYLTPDIINVPCSLTNKAYAIYDGAIWNIAILSSSIHLVWIATVCGRMKTDYSYSNKMGWNTFPLPILTQKNIADLTTCAEDILIARAAHFPANIAELYEPDKMPEDLRHAHNRNDEVVERIFIGRRFKNDTERLEKLFEMYSKMATNQQSIKNGK